MVEDGQGKIVCANCLHCKVVMVPDASTGSKVAKVRCAAGMWKKKVGEEKLYRFDTVEQRRVSSCNSYEDMGDQGQWLKELKRTMAPRGVNII